MAHRITPDDYDIRCTCGWVYIRPVLLDEWRTNRAIRKHLTQEAK